MQLNTHGISRCGCISFKEIDYYCSNGFIVASFGGFYSSVAEVCVLLAHDTVSSGNCSQHLKISHPMCQVIQHIIPEQQIHQYFPLS